MATMSEDRQEEIQTYSYIKKTILKQSRHKERKKYRTNEIKT